MHIGFGRIYFASVFLFIYEGPAFFWTPLSFNVWTKTVETFFKISCFMFCSRKKVIRLWNDLRLNMWIFNFERTIPLGKRLLLFQKQVLSLPKYQIMKSSSEISIWIQAFLTKNKKKSKVICLISLQCQKVKFVFIFISFTLRTFRRNISDKVDTKMQHSWESHLLSYESATPKQ